MVPSIAAPSSQQHQRRRSLGNTGFGGAEQEVADNSNNNNNKQQPTKPRGMASFGSLLRRVGGSQRRMEEEGDQQQQHQHHPMGSQSERGLGGFLRRTKSLRGVDSTASTRRLDLQEADEGPSGVASFLEQIEPEQPKQEQVPTEVTAPAEPKKKEGGLLRGLMKRAASFTTASTKTKKEQPPNEFLPNLEPVLVLTDENHGRVVFQNLETLDPAYCESSVSDMSWPCATKPSAESPKMSCGSFHTARTSPSTTRDSGSTLDDSQFFLEFSELEDMDYPEQEDAKQVVDEEAEEMSDNSFTGRLKNMFGRTQSGRILQESSEDVMDHPTDDSSGDSSEGSESLVNARQHAPEALREISLPMLVEDGDDDQEEPYCMDDLLDAMEEDEDYEKETCYSTSSNEESYSEGDLDVLHDEDHTRYRDIETEAQPHRVYDELELFYEEQTFEHVGGSYLLGAQSELMTIPEYDDEGDCESEEEEEEYYSDEEIYRNSEASSGSLLRSYLSVVEEGMDESFSSSGSISC